MLSLYAFLKKTELPDNLKNNIVMQLEKENYKLKRKMMQLGICHANAVNKLF